MSFDKDKLFVKTIITGAQIAQLVERAAIYRGLLLNAVVAGSTPTCGPLLHVIPPLSPLSCLQLSYINKRPKMPQKIILNFFASYRAALVSIDLHYVELKSVLSGTHVYLLAVAASSDLLLDEPGGLLLVVQFLLLLLRLLFLAADGLRVAVDVLDVPAFRGLVHLAET